MSNLSPMREIIFFGLLGMLLSGCQTGPVALGTAPDATSVGHTLDSLHETGLHAGAVALVRDGMLWGQWFHGVERSGGEAVTERSAFRLASVSKQFTVSGILVAAEQGRLALDDDIRAYLLECPYEGVTVRLSLIHI